MKKIGTYTVRGKITSATIERIRLFDGRFDTGYVITKFMMIINDPDNSGVDCYGILGTQEDTIGTQWNLSRQDQIGWASMNAAGSATGPQSFPFHLVDRDNLVVEDLYVYAETNAAAAICNYYIEMDKYEFPTAKGALTMVRNKQQAVD
jgi:hypothetical protein